MMTSHINFRARTLARTHQSVDCAPRTGRQGQLVLPTGPVLGLRQDAYITTRVYMFRDKVGAT